MVYVADNKNEKVILTVGPRYLSCQTNIASHNCLQTSFKADACIEVHSFFSFH